MPGPNAASVARIDLELIQWRNLQMSVVGVERHENRSSEGGGNCAVRLEGRAALGPRRTLQVPPAFEH